ncbi:MAG: guanylate kinase [Candidatus Aminicenantes bacterium]|nr:guanylate kinase [Candidatus Aminicenantes bacterium]
MLFVISGPSGCGKSTLVQKARKQIKDLQFSVSHTTRKKRPSEKEGKDYYFVSKSEFRKKIKHDEMVEWAIVHGNMYGTARREIERRTAQEDLVLDIDVQGAHQLKDKFRKAVFIFILPPNYQQLEQRLKKRGEESVKSIQDRLRTAKKEIRSYSDFDYIVINDQLEKAVQELASIVLSVRCRIEVRQKDIGPIIRTFNVTKRDYHE